MRERGRLADQVGGVQKLKRDVPDALDLIELAEAAGDEATITAAVAGEVGYAAEAKRHEMESWPTPNDAYLEVNTSAGGTRARTGPRCCCACTCAGRSGAATR